MHTIPDPVAVHKTMPLQPRTVVRRQAARVLLVDDADRLLVFHGPTIVKNVGDTCYWLPGGGIERGETPVQAAARELAEETGIVIEPAKLGKPVATWFALQQLSDGRFFTADELFYFHRVGDTPRVCIMEPSEQATRTGADWLTATDLAYSSVRILPRGIPALLERLLEHGAPATPIRI